MAKKAYDHDMGWNKLYTQFKVNKGEAGVFVGFLRSSGVYEGKEGNGLTVAQVGAIHEFGSKDGRIPERSFMRSTIADNREQLITIITKIAKKVSEGKLTKIQGLGLIGEFLRGKMVAKIDSGVPPPNAPSTKARKGSSRPLIDTGQLKGSIDWEVHEGKKVTGSEEGNK